MSPDDKNLELESTFKIFDENGDHFITASELKNVMKRLGQCLSDDEVDLMILEADSDGDKKVNYKEFVQLMRKLDFWWYVPTQFSETVQFFSSTLEYNYFVLVVIQIYIIAIFYTKNILFTEYMLNIQLEK